MPPSSLQPAPTHPSWLYRIVRRVLIPLAMTFWVRLDVEGREHIPPCGPFIAVSNHVDNNDSYAIIPFLPSTVHFMARPTGMRSRFLGRFWRAMEAIPANRDGLVQALALLRAGDAVGVYPDGVITPQLLRAKAGAALLAVRAGVPVLPVAVWGTEKVRAWPFPHGRRVQVHMRFGRPRTLQRAEVRARGLQGLADSIMTDVATLLPPEYRGYYAAAVEAGPAERDGAVPAEGTGVEQPSHATRERMR